MKALTLWQPWASLVAHRIKTIETRSWSTNYRGPLAIHAAQRPPVVGASVAVRGWSVGHHRLRYHDHVDEGYTLSRLGEETTCRLPLGVVLATAELVDVIPMAHAGEEGAIRTLDIDGDGSLWIVEADPGELEEQDWREVTDQRPFGDYTPGRFAWLLEHIEPLAEPVPARGRQQLWEWAA